MNNITKSYKTFEVNEETGECDLAQGGRYYSEEEYRVMQQKREQEREWAIRVAANDERTRRYGNFTFFRYEFLSDVLSSYNLNQVARLFLMATYLPYRQSNILQYRNGTKISKKELQKLLILSDGSFRRFLEDMSGIIVMENDGVQLNSSLFERNNIRGQREQTNSFIRIYHKAYRFLYKKLTVRKHQQLGYLIRLIPYLHRTTNIICNNPYVESEENLNTLGMRKICDVIGYEYNQVSRLVKNLQYLTLENGQPVFLYNRDKDIAAIHPELFYAGSSWEAILQEWGCST